MQRPKETGTAQEAGKTMQTKLDLISDMVKGDRGSRISNVAYLLNEENLGECFRLLEKGKAAGVDGITLEAYGADLRKNLRGLVERMRNQSYRPQPVRRAYIPKADGRMRPLGIPAIEDKVVQKGMARILEAVYEPEFLDCSYGFRAKRDCHQALDRLDKIIMAKPIGHIIDADIKGFFDHVDHVWMMKFLGHRISDPNFLRLAGRFLRNGYMEEGREHAVGEGTPQGGIISPVLANVYLHYVLDLWVEKVVRPHCRGAVEMVRYADDFVICVQYGDDAERILGSLRERLGKFGLELAEDKTRLIKFGRNAGRDAEARGEKPASFNFLGFTHYADKTRTGKFKLGRLTDRKRMAVKLKELNGWLRSMRNMMPIKDLWALLKAKMTGHVRYYGVSGNYRGVSRFLNEAKRLVKKWLNRRSQKRSFDCESFILYIRRHPLPKPRICHDFYSLKPCLRT